MVHETVDVDAVIANTKQACRANKKRKISFKIAGTKVNRSSGRTLTSGGPIHFQQRLIGKHCPYLVTLNQNIQQ